VRDANKTFSSGSRTIQALADVCIDVAQGESVGVVGESGSGKTTLARSLVGLESLTSGEISIGGVEAGQWSALSRRERDFIRGTVQIVFQDPYSSLNPVRTVGSTLKEAIATRDPAARKIDGGVSELLETVGLPPSYARRKPVALSGGERQRVAIARSLAAQPRILICDEPCSALDVSVQAQILNLFKKLRDERGIGYLFITHDLSIVRQVCDRLYVMHRGRVVESGLTERVMNAPEHSYTAALVAAVPSSDSDWLAIAEPTPQPVTH
jgi:peptide/nickel transport system ATP-binding protein